MAPAHKETPAEPATPTPEAVHPDAPRHKSPVKWMAGGMIVFIVMSVYAMWGGEKISIKASVTVPPLTASGTRGQQVFAAACQSCHGVNASGGSRTGPPLVHPMYRSETYPDFVFKRAVREGKRDKNWRFGPMPAMDSLSEQQIDDVSAFVRALQTASGAQ